MQSASEIVKKHSKSGPPTLTGSDLNARTNTITITLLKVEPSPDGWTAPFKVTFKPPIKSVQPGRGEVSVWGINKTNTKALIEKYGDNYEDWEGKRITLGKVSANNPTTNKPTWGLRVMG